MSLDKHIYMGVDRERMGARLCGRMGKWYSGVRVYVELNSLLESETSGRSIMDGKSIDYFATFFIS